MASFAGRPPFSTHLPSSANAQHQPRAPYGQPPMGDPNARLPSPHNRYNAYSNGGNHKSDRTQIRIAAPVAQSVPQQQTPIPLLAPKPGYVASISALNQAGQSQYPENPRFPPGIGPVHTQPNPHEAPRMPPAVVHQHPPPLSPIVVPSTPHPLPTITPIRPVFARPSKPTEARDVKWGPEPILRGNSEEKLLPRRGDKGDDFWRRFSMIAKEDSSHKQSAWLRKTQSGANRLSFLVWVLGIIVFSCAGLGIGLGWYLSHKAPPHQDPTTVGGRASDTMVSSISQPTGTPGTGNDPAAPLVTPTYTVARRDAFPGPLQTPTPGAPIRIMHIIHPHGSRHGSAPYHQRRRLKRAVV